MPTGGSAVTSTGGTGPCIDLDGTNSGGAVSIVSIPIQFAPGNTHELSLDVSGSQRSPAS